VSCADSAIEKQPACAAATSSSGFVPLASSNRVLNEYGVSRNTPLALEIVPRPSFRLPFHLADAVRFMPTSERENRTLVQADAHSPRPLDASRWLPHSL
jgi:hypothetical protein